MSESIDALKKEIHNPESLFIWANLLKGVLMFSFIFSPLVDPLNVKDVDNAIASVYEELPKRSICVLLLGDNHSEFLDHLRQQYAPIKSTLEDFVNQGESTESIIKRFSRLLFAISAKQ
jgi:hypothetical protein